MKRLFFGSALFVLFVGFTSLAPSAKFKYSSTEGKVSAVFPGEFSTSEEIQETYRTVKTQAVVEDMVFFVAYTVHSIQMDDEEELTRVSVEAFMEGLEAEVTEESTWKVKKHNGLQVKLAVKDKSLVGEYRVVIVGQIQYQITALAADESWDENKALKFFKSFKVLK